MAEFTLVTLPGCRPCHAVKEYLDRLTYEDDIQYGFTFKIIDASRADDFVRQNDIQSAPTLISPTGKTLVGNPGRDKLRDWICQELIAFEEIGE